MARESAFANRPKQREPDPALPTGFRTITSILESAKPGQVVNVLGVVTDRRSATKTQKNEYKSTLTLVDLSTQEGGSNIELSVFTKTIEEHPEDINAGDVILLLQVKVQAWNGGSLVTNRNQSVVHVYDVTKIPQYPKPAQGALKPSAWARKGRSLTEEEHKYVSYLSKALGSDEVPDQSDFAAKVEASRNVKQKYKLLEQVSDNTYVDLVARVVRQPYDLGDKMTLYVSDYSSNEQLFDYTQESVKNMSEGGDEYGSPKSSTSADGDSKKWIGPYGKRTIQITAYGRQAEFLKEEVRVGDWVWLGNVFIRHGRNDMHLEGFLRDGALDDPTQSNQLVRIMEHQNRDTIDPRVKDAIRRMRDYDKQNKAELKQLKAAQEAGAKRRCQIESAGKVTKRENNAAPICDTKRQRLQDSDQGTDQDAETSPEILNAKKRRNLKRERKKAKELEQKKEALLKQQAQKNQEQKQAVARAEADLNPYVKCENPVEKPSRVEEMLQYVEYETIIDDKPVKLLLPFNNTKYHAHLRVVDFYPHRLEEFASGHFISDYDVLSDNSAAQSDSSSDETDAGGNGSVVWEWNFMLEVEDAAKLPDQEVPDRMWVRVDNPGGQCLTGLDASNLEQDADTLAVLRERLFVLWGNLEEEKREEVDRKGETQAKLQRQLAMAQNGKKMPADEPPPSSDAEYEAIKQPVANKPFSCCIQQYGVEVPKKGTSEKKWKREYLLFGTKIAIS